MAKRELIEREKLINELIESSKHHAQTSREESLLHRDRQIVREQHTITEQDIVKPILDKIRAEIEEEMLSHCGTGEETVQAYADGLKKGLEIFDKYKAESEVKE